MNLNRIASRAVVFTTCASMFFGSFPAAIAGTPTAGDTATKVPTVEQACTALRNAADGKLLDMNGKSLTFTSPDCAGKAKRARTAESCQKTAEELTKGGETADTLCTRDQGSLNSEAATFCALRAINKTNTTTKYCDAYDSAVRAQSGLTTMLAVDGVSAAVCWTEFASLRSLMANGTADSINNAATKAGPCSIASIGAALAEIVNIIAANTGKNSHPTGEYEIDSDNNAVLKSDKKGVNMTKLLDIILSSGLSLAVLRNGLCQQTRGASRTAVQNSNGAVSIDTQAHKGALGMLGPEGLKNVCGFLNTRITREAKNGRLASDNINKALNDSQDAENQSNTANEIADQTLQALISGGCGSQAVTDYVQSQSDLKKIQEDGVQGHDPQAGLGMYAHIGLSGKSSGAVCTPEDTKLYEAAIKKAQAAVETAKVKLIATDATGKAAEKVADAKRLAKGAQDARAALEQAKIDAARTNLQPRVDITKSSAMMLTALAAIRGVSLASAGSTKKKAEEILQSMFNSGNGTVNFGGAGPGAGGGFYVNTTTTFAPSSTGTPTSQAVTAGTPEFMLLPPGSPLHSTATQLASQIPGSKVQSAAESGPAGIGGLISAAASGMGAKDVREINPAVATAFANLPKDDGAGYAGGGGKSLAKSGGDTGGDLNLKSLFGAGDKEERAGAAAAGLAFRGPASDDIWHSQNPKGNNLFQIVSDRYDNTIRRQDLSP